ncbi:MAG: response regulator transcription factor [Vallitalea sp.]|jgi:DNA-binding response OmpR family regulator|nr:response regulator transcription factor [Vallitalea sp.]
MKKTVLVIEDETIMRDMICKAFRSDGFDVLEAVDGQEALEVFADNKVDLVLLDIVLPKLDGWSVCRRIRTKSDVAIIMITSREDDEDQLLGYELGVDEYVIKPPNIKVLLAKSNRLLQRIMTTNDNVKSIIGKCGISIDKDAYSVMIDNEKVEFAPKEYELLLYLVENEGRVLTREQILDTVWGYDYFGDYRVVDTHIKKIRKKLSDKAKYIHTVVRAGYKFE